ncbi:SMI1/KNR4 family protein [Algibacillus agarilyticus]|uniref:SMI1/KNR4 family protein n=1 Tax=Algibacillus agarilyticus TaxID=2234133 RepID=UPI000DCF6E11|nr:SMI1/KNR4 family protein [Algibacillus agarilyticus]
MKFIEFIRLLKEKYIDSPNITTENGSVLLRNVPDIAPKAYLHSLYAPLDESEIEDLEAQISYALPEELKQFYMTVNGLDFYCGTLYMYGLRKDKARTVLATIQQPFDIAMPNNTSFGYHISRAIYIGAYKYDGSVVGYDIDNGKVFRQSKSNKEILNQWADLHEFIYNEYDRLFKLIDVNGNKQKGVKSTVPERLIH